jgi:hypothetical protein
VLANAAAAPTKAAKKRLLEIAIGLTHNADPTKLLCGRPAPCRPMEFKSTTEHYFH